MIFENSYTFNIINNKRIQPKSQQFTMTHHKKTHPASKFHWLQPRLTRKTIQTIIILAKCKDYFTGAVIISLSWRINRVRRRRRRGEGDWVPLGESSRMQAGGRARGSWRRTALDRPSCKNVRFNFIESAQYGVRVQWPDGAFIFLLRNDTTSGCQSSAMIFFSQTKLNVVT